MSVSAITRWVLAHKRTRDVVLGRADRGGYRDRELGDEGDRPEVLGSRQGGLGDERRDHRALPRYWGRHGPDRAGGHAPAGRDRQLARRATRSSTQIDNKLEQALPGARIASFASTGDRAFVSKRRAHHVRDRLSEAGPEFRLRREPRRRQGRPRGARATSTIAGAPVHVSGFDALQNESGGDSGTGVLLESVLGGVGALIVLAFVFASFLALRAASRWRSSRS